MLEAETIYFIKKLTFLALPHIQSLYFTYEKLVGQLIGEMKIEQKINEEKVSQRWRVYHDTLSHHQGLYA
jgi:ascorbate-specific PTS system EIIC-type component UlaA